MLLIHRNDRKSCSIIVRRLHDFYKKCTSKEEGESYCLQRRSLIDGYSTDNDGNLAASLILGPSQRPPSIESTKIHENLSFSKVTIENDQTRTRIENRAKPSPSEIAFVGYPEASTDDQMRSNPQQDFSVDTVHIPSNAQRFSLRKVTELVVFVRNWLCRCFGAWSTQDEVQS